MSEEFKSKVLIDNWTLHNIAFGEQPCEDGAQLRNLENLLFAILLWDEIYFWDNGQTTWWKDDSLLLYKVPFLKGIILEDEMSFKVSNIRDSDMFARSVQQYQLIASEEGCDYLPHRKRYQYLTSHQYYNAENMLLQRVIFEKVEKDIQKYYADIMKRLGNIQLKFRFPLLLDYIKHQPEYVGDYIEAALHIRENGSLYRMREWIAKLNTHIDAGNWGEVKYYIDNIEAVVPSISAPSMRDVEFAIQIGLPLSLSASLSISGQKNLLQDIHHRIQLTFLHDIASFAKQRQPEA